MFADGETTKRVKVETREDSVAERDEPFDLVLDPRYLGGITVQKGKGRATIVTAR